MQSDIRGHELKSQVLTQIFCSLLFISVCVMVRGTYGQDTNPVAGFAFQFKPPVDPIDVAKLLDTFLDEKASTAVRVQCSTEITRSSLLWPTDASVSVSAQQLTTLRAISESAGVDKQILNESLEVIAALSTRTMGLAEIEKHYWELSTRPGSSLADFFIPTLLLYSWKDDHTIDMRMDHFRQFLGSENCTRERLMMLCATLDATYKTIPDARNSVLDLLIEIGLSDDCDQELSRYIFRVIGGIRLLEQVLDSNATG